MSNVVRIDPAAGGGMPLLTAIEEFLATGDFAATTIAKYRATLEQLVKETDGDYDVARITLHRLEKHLRTKYGHCAPNTYNRHLATLGSFFTWCADHDLITTNPTTKLKRRKQRRTTEAERQSRPIPWTDIDALIRNTSHDIRERTYWAMLYDTAARADEVLSINIEDLDTANKRAIIGAKGGNAETIYWASTTARLLPRIIAGRSAGPLFITSRRAVPSRQPATSDICPTTGHSRLSYRRAEELFVTATGGNTLHQLRHAALTHLAENGIGPNGQPVDVVMLKAKSRHKSLRSLERYINPGPAAIANLTNRNDPNRRHK